MTQAYKGQLFGQIKIAVVSTGKYVMPYFISGFMKEHPNLELEMDVSNKLRVIESIQKNEVDLALVSVLPENLNVEKVDLIVNKLYLIGGTTSSGSSKEDKKTNFEGMPLLYREKGSGTRQSMERFIEKKRIMVNKRMELTSNEAVKQAIIAGLGISIVPLIGIQNEIKNGQLKILPVKGLPLKTTWSLIWPKGKQHSPATAAFLSYLEKHKHDIIRKQFGWYQQFQ
jgi:DNA-binding transcriptional LysR family regulator